MAHAHSQLNRRGVGFSMLMLGTLLAMGPWRPAHAYIDPNTAGPLYQFLFPFLIAAASALAALRRYIARAWNRMISAVVSVVRGQRARPEGKDS